MKKKEANSVVRSRRYGPSCGLARDELLRFGEPTALCVNGELDMWVYILAGAITTPEAL